MRRVCAHACPTGSLVLERTERTVEPPADVRDYGARFATDRQRGAPLLRRRQGE